MTDSYGNEIGKLFIGGLSQSTNNESLLAYFLQFGEIEEAAVMMDSKTRRSRGFGYVKYANPDVVKMVLESKPHIVNSKEVDPKQCNINMKGKNRRSLKIFVGGIAPEHNVDDVREFFEQYGQVTDINLMPDQSKERHRGFAFVGFDDENVVRSLIAMHFVYMNGKQIEIKAMEPPDFTKKIQQSQPQPPVVNTVCNHSHYDYVPLVASDQAMWPQSMHLPQHAPMSCSPVYHCGCTPANKWSTQWIPQQQQSCEIAHWPMQPQYQIACQPNMCTTQYNQPVWYSTTNVLPVSVSQPVWNPQPVWDQKVVLQPYIATNKTIAQTILPSCQREYEDTAYKSQSYAQLQIVPINPIPTLTNDPDDQNHWMHSNGKYYKPGEEVSGNASGCTDASGDFTQNISPRIPIHNFPVCLR